MTGHNCAARNIGPFVEKFLSKKNGWVFTFFNRLMNISRISPGVFRSIKSDLINIHFLNNLSFALWRNYQANHFAIDYIFHIDDLPWLDKISAVCDHKIYMRYLCVFY